MNAPNNDTAREHRNDLKYFWRNPNKQKNDTAFEHMKDLKLELTFSVLSEKTAEKNL